MPRRHTIAEMHELAARLNGECLSREYRNARTPLRWRCAAQHEWSALPSNIRNHGSWCPECAGVKRHTLDEMMAAAAARGGACLSTEYRGINEHLRWRCACTFEWEAIPKSVLAGTWCPKCAGNLRSDVAEMRALAEARNGVCLAEDYLGDGKSIPWRCASGHAFAATPSNVKRGRWCPVCSTALGERLARSAFEQLFGDRFPRQWPSWLVGEGGGRMELDGYCERLGLAFEHQGEQHVRELKQFHRTADAFRRQRGRDHAKREACARNGVTLIEVAEVPTRIGINALAQFIADAVAEAKTPVARVLEPEQVCFDEVYRTDRATLELARLQTEAARRGGRLLSTHYARRDERLAWECSEKHRWLARPANVLNGKQWCARCARCAKLGLADLHRAAAEHGGKCLATAYRNNATKVRWRCARGHEFEAAFASVRRKHWCAQCQGVARYDVDFMHALAAGRGGSYVSADYRGMNEVAKWRCAAGHVFEMTPSAVKNARRWCRECRRSARRD